MRPLTETDFTKLCSRCGPDVGPQPLTAFYRDRKSPDGYGARCKACRKATEDRSDARKERQRVYARERMRRMRAEQPDKVKAAKKAHRERHLDRMREKDAAYHAAYRESRNARSSAAHHADRDADRDARNATRRERYAANDEAESKRRWRAENPERARAQVSKARAQRLQAPGSYTEADVLAIYEEQGGLC